MSKKIIKQSPTDKPGFTPGPWRQSSFTIWSPSAKATIAAVSALRATRYVSRDDAAELNEVWANARLIAAAPALYEALREAEELAAFHEGSQEKKTSSLGAQSVVWINYEDHMRVLNKIRAALSLVEEEK